MCQVSTYAICLLRVFWNNFKETFPTVHLMNKKAISLVLWYCCILQDVVGGLWILEGIENVSSGDYMTEGYILWALDTLWINYCLWSVWKHLTKLFTMGIISTHSSHFVMSFKIVPIILSIWNPGSNERTVTTTLNKSRGI